MIRERIEQLHSLLSVHNCDAVFVCNESNVTYLSGYTNRESYLFLTGSGANIFITDFRYTEQAARECTDFDIQLYSNAHLSLPETLTQLCRRHKVKNLAFEQEDVSFALYNQLHQALSDVALIPTSGIIAELRYRKDAEEISRLRKACATTDRVFAGILDFITAGKTEREVEWELLRLMNMQGLCSGFSPIVASGVNGSLPHAVPGDKALAAGEFLTMDFGCLYQGYHADITRTVCIGEPDAKMREIYAIVLEANLRAQAAMRAGVPCREVDAAARGFIADQGYGQQFGHGLGHGVGLDIHENPFMNTRTAQELHTGCVVTVEPGIYIPGWGGVRIEDTVLITENGAESLFACSKQLICL